MSADGFLSRLLTESTTLSTSKEANVAELREVISYKKTRTLDYLISFTGYLLILLPAAVGILYVWAFGVSVVKRDAWTMVPLFERWSSGTLQASDFFVQHFEHRSAFPEIAMLLLGIITKYNNVAEMYLIQVCLLAMLVILLVAFRATIKSTLGHFPLLGLFLFVPISLLIFSFRQNANWLFGYQINFAFVGTFGVLTLFLLYVLGRSRFQHVVFAGALVSATVATYSIVAGLLVWPAGLLQLFIGPLESSKKRVFGILWGLVGCFVWVTYHRNWTPGRDCSSFIDWNYYSARCQSGVDGESSPSLLYIFDHPLTGIDYFLNLLSSALLWPDRDTLEGGLFGQHLLGSVTGLLLVCLALVGLFLAYKSRRLSDYSFWVSFMFYAFLILAATTAGRSERGAEQALAGRYTSFAVLAVMSIYGLLAITALERGLSIRNLSVRSLSISTILVVFLSGAVLLSTATTSYPKGIAAGKANKKREAERAYVLSTYESQPDKILSEAAGIGVRQERDTGAKVARERAPVLQRLGYNVFSEPQVYEAPKKYGREK